MLALFTGQAMAQRCLPGMSAVEVKANMADGFIPATPATAAILSVSITRFRG